LIKKCLFPAAPVTNIFSKSISPFLKFFKFFNNKKKLFFYYFLFCSLNILYKKPSFLRLRSLNEPFEDKSKFKKFDIVTDHGTCECVYNVGECYKTMHKLSKKNGYMIIHQHALKLSFRLINEGLKFLKVFFKHKFYLL